MTTWKYTASSQEIVRSDGVLIAREVLEEFGPMIAKIPAIMAAASALFRARDDWEKGCPDPIAPKYNALRNAIARARP